MDSTTDALGAIFVCMPPNPRVRDPWAHVNSVAARRGTFTGGERAFVPWRSGHGPCNEERPFEK